jgi:NTP pyrophosphatase (non-canonical NTP hydrolase)
MKKEITHEMEDLVRNYLTREGLQFFKIIYNLVGTVNVVISPIDVTYVPHPTHFREGMQIRNLLRESKLCPDWTDHDYDNNWFRIVESAIEESEFINQEADLYPVDDEIEPNLNSFQIRLCAAKNRYLSLRQTIEPLPRLLNIGEELGELLREERLYNEGFDFNKKKAKDAVGDIFIALIGYCISKQWNAHNILKKTLDKVIERWESGKYTGDRNYPTLAWLKEHEAQSKKENNRDKE